MAFRIDRRERLEGLVCLLVELVALEHVVSHDSVQRYVLVLEQILDQLIQSCVLLLKARELQPGSLL